MPHKCTKCGREYKDGSTEILEVCASCGSKKFLYVKEAEINNDVLEEKSISLTAEDTKEDVLEVVEPKTKERSGDVRPGRDHPHCLPGFLRTEP